MAGMLNVISAPVPAPGLVAVGDAACTTDPAFGRGVSIAIAAAWALADALEADAGTGGLSTFTLWFDENIRPWYDDAVRTDAWRTDFWRSALSDVQDDVGGAPPRDPADEPSAGAGQTDIDADTLFAVAASVGGSTALWRAFVRHCMLLASPTALLNDETVTAARQVLEDGWVMPASTMPSRAQVLDALAQR